MTTYDRLAISLGNLWRMKLRSILTISGVVIAIAAFVSMLSFGAGNQQLVTEQFEKLGLLSTMIVSPPHDEDSDSIAPVVLDEQAIGILQNLLYNEGFVSIPYLKLDPLWNNLRSHPGFIELVDTTHPGQ